jgi:hypothetical protein
VEFFEQAIERRRRGARGGPRAAGLGGRRRRGD